MPNVEQITPRGTPCVYKKQKFLSKFEMSLAKILDSKKLKWSYEPCTVQYQPPVAEYTPDFLITMPDGAQQYVEVKGFFDPMARAKMLLVKEQHPELDIAFLFMRGNNRLSKSAKSMTYEEWAKKNGFKILAIDKHTRELNYV